MVTKIPIIVGIDVLLNICSLISLYMYVNSIVIIINFHIYIDRYRSNIYRNLHENWRNSFIATESRICKEYCKKFRGINSA